MDRVAVLHPLAVALLFGCTIAVIVVLTAQYLQKRRVLNLPGIPLVKTPASGDFRRALTEANAKYPDRPYMLAFRDPTVIIPAHYVEKLKNLPDSQLSTNGSQYDRFAIRWTESGLVYKELAHSVKYDLSSRVDELMPSLVDDVEVATAKWLPASDSWESLPPRDALTDVFASVLGRVLVGAPMNRDEKWLSASTDHAMTVVGLSSVLRFFPAVLKPLVARFHPQRKALDESKRSIDDMILPTVQQGLRDMQSTDTKVDSKEQWKLTTSLLKRYNPSGNAAFSPSLVLRDHYSLCFAGIHGPTFLIVQAIIDLASYPQYVEPLRAEIDRELAKAPMSAWTRETVARLTYMDAFCKESARLNPQGLIAWLRKTHQPVTLPNGSVIPTNTLIATTGPIFNPEATPLIKDVNKFHPERWLVDRSDPSTDAPFRYGSATVDSLIFGYGKHACPGRAFGITMVKAIMTHIVGGWDMRLAGGGTKRPDNIYIDFMILPPVAPLGDVEIEFRRRSNKK